MASSSSTSTTWSVVAGGHVGDSSSAVTFQGVDHPARQPQPQPQQPREGLSYFVPASLPPTVPTATGGHHSTTAFQHQQLVVSVVNHPTKDSPSDPRSNSFAQPEQIVVNVKNQPHLNPNDEDTSDPMYPRVSLVEDLSSGPVVSIHGDVTSCGGSVMTPTVGTGLSGSSVQWNLLSKSEKMAVRRAHESEESRMRRLEKGRVRARERRANETEEQKRERRKKDAERNRLRRSGFSNPATPIPAHSSQPTSYGPSGHQNVSQGEQPQILVVESPPSYVGSVVGSSHVITPTLSTAQNHINHQNPGAQGVNIKMELPTQPIPPDAIRNTASSSSTTQLPLSLAGNLPASLPLPPHLLVSLGQNTIQGSGDAVSPAAHPAASPADSAALAGLTGAERRRERERIRMRQVRAGESPEQRAVRLERDRERARERRAKLAQDEESARQERERNRIATRDRRARMPEEKKELTRLRQNMAAAQNRAQETPERRAARLAKGREYARRKRAAEDPAEKAARLARQREAGKWKRQVLFACAQSQQQGAQANVNAAVTSPGTALIGWPMEESKPIV